MVAEAVVDAEAVTDVQDAAALVAAGEAAATRSVVEEPVDGAPGSAVVVTDLDGTHGDEPARRPLVGRRPVGRHLVGRTRRAVASVLRRRPAVYLAVALLGTIGVGAVYVGPAAEADPVDEPSHSMSVAAELGISSEQTLTAPDAHDADRLAEIAASRASRAAEQTAAVQAQQEADRIAAEAAAAAAAEAARPKAVLPVSGARLTSGFGHRWGTLHAGIDLAAPIGTPEYAAADGVVLETGPASGFGLAIYIQHENGDVTVYGHMQKILVKPGQVVKAGDTIALLGNRGQSTGPHLHFEVHQGGLNGPKIDPVPWLRERGVQI